MEVHEFTQSPAALGVILGEMRDVELQKDRRRFRENLRKIGFLLGYEISKFLDYEPTKITTPLEETQGVAYAQQQVIVSVLRAGIPFHEGLLDCFPDAENGFIGAFRQDESSNTEVALSYHKMPSVQNKTVLLADPMLATGKSIVKSLEKILEHGQPVQIHIVSVVAAPEGIEYISKNLMAKATLWAAAVDDRLNEKAYIVPGLGDAGDLCFGPKL